MCVILDVLMPVYNAGPFLSDSVKSLQAQTNRAWRLIVVDDGSTDGSTDVVVSLSRHDTRIHLLRNPRNLGLGLSRQRAFECATAPFCGVLDSDDLIDPDWLAYRLLRLDSDPSLVAVSGSRRLIDARGAGLGERIAALSPAEVNWALHFGNPVVNSSTVFRTHEGRAAGGYPAYRYLEDWAFFRRLRKRGGILQEKKASVSYRIHGANSSVVLSKRRDIIKLAAENILEDLDTGNVPSSVKKEAAWALFRGKAPEVVAATAICQAYDVLTRFYGEIPEIVRRSGELPSLVLDDINNLLRCSPPRQRAPWTLALRTVRPPRAFTGWPRYLGALSRFVLRAGSRLGVADRQRNGTGRF